MKDEHYGDPAASSIRYAAEASLAKPSTDVLLLGHAYARHDSPAMVDVGLRVGPVVRVVRVFGDRQWRRGLLGLTPSSPEPFEKIPLQYELAFGGTDADPKNPAKVDYEPRNPVGRGLVPKGSNGASAGLLLPNLEDPEHLVRGAGDRPAPAGFGPICGHWEPRKGYAGTYDEQWTQSRAPYLPVDFDPRFLQCAPPGLVAPAYLKGGEPVVIDGVTRDGSTITFDLPICAIQLVFDLDGSKISAAPNLDTVLIEPDSDRVTLIWRASQTVDKKLLRLRELVVNCPQHPKRKVA
jgi:hypothetical protein